MKALATRLLNATYNQIISTSHLEPDSVVLVYGWKNTSSNTKTVTCSLHTVDGPKAFVNAWDVTGEPETAHKLCTIISETIDLAKDTYNTNIYAVVSDNASAMHMRIIAAEARNNKKIKPNIISIIFNDDFVDEVRNNLTLYEPICDLINKCQSQSASVADAVHYWLELELPENVRERFSEKLEARKKMAFNVYALAAYYLHPVYSNEKLSSQNMTEINHFLFKSLSNVGCDEWDIYKRNVNIFKELNDKNITKPLLYWRMAAMYCKELPKLALRLLQIPASSGEIEHNPILNEEDTDFDEGEDN
ncbi:hypothetical protein NQ317_015473 [Molorchus minor]|uniref:DUF659 domain-containing protein n=1 Tax=Molorchus minor TaxID=1323400 RepID=A0ABQ9J8H9_9CUCU|nr:hypothetical protein NQ317_015473 [Molorchus minor]